MPVSLIPSLLHLASVKVSYELFLNSPRRITLEDFYPQWFYNLLDWEHHWRLMLHHALHNLNIPSSLREDLRRMIRPMGEEILQWKVSMISLHRHCTHVIQIHCRCVFPEISNFIDFFGSPHVSSIGCIDEKKSAQYLIDNPMLDDPFRFVLACMYCFGSKVLSLWQRLGPRQQRIFSANKDFFFVSMVGYWVNILETGTAFVTLMPPFQPPHFEDYQNNPAVLHYVLGNLPPEERSNHLEMTAVSCYTDSKLFRACLLQMDGEQLVNFLTIYPERVLLCFLQWPWQCVFLKVIEMTWSFLNEDHFFNIMQYILLSKITPEVLDYDYVNLLRNIWQNTPRHLRVHVQNFFRGNLTWQAIIR